MVKLHDMHDRHFKNHYNIRIIEESNPRMRILIWIDTQHVAWRIESIRAMSQHRMILMIMMQHSKHGWLDPWLDPAHGRMPAACGSVLYTWDNLLIGKIYIEKKLIETNATLAEKKLHIQSPQVGFVSITFFFSERVRLLFCFFQVVYVQKQYIVQRTAYDNKI